jgi:hypothetical protein
VALQWITRSTQDASLAQTPHASSLFVELLPFRIPYASFAHFE